MEILLNQRFLLLEYLCEAVKQVAYPGIAHEDKVSVRKLISILLWQWIQTLNNTFSVVSDVTVACPVECLSGAIHLNCFHVE